MNKNVPNHVAIIMDGNRRWAEENSLSIKDAYKKGADNAKVIIEEASNIGIKYLTLFAFSSENWNRKVSEVSLLMDLMEFYLNDFLDFLILNNIDFDTIGDLSRFSNVIQSKIEKCINKKSEDSKLKLLVALNYGSRNEIIMAVKNICLDVKMNKISIDDINDNIFSSYLYTKNIPDPDMLIRTSGEQRLSNFLLWQLPYTELYFASKLWPDFTSKDLNLAVNSYKKRERRYGEV